jgi:hypothetical protein
MMYLDIHSPPSTIQITIGSMARARLNVTAPPQQHRRLRSSLVQPWDANAAYGGHTKRLHPILRHKPSHADHALGVPDNYKEMPGVVRKGNTNRRENRGLLSVRRHQFLQHAAQSLPITLIRPCHNSRLHAHCFTCERPFFRLETDVCRGAAVRRRCPRVRSFMGQHPPKFGFQRHERTRTE